MLLITIGLLHFIIDTLIKTVYADRTTIPDKTGQNVHLWLFLFMRLLQLNG
jgi:hypothetical protein